MYLCKLQITLTREVFQSFSHLRNFFGNVIGSNGSVLNSIQQDTNTIIKIPKRGENDDVVITGKNERAVITAKNRIDLIVCQAREKHPFTHFISIPMVSDMVRHNFDVFKVG